MDEDYITDDEGSAMADLMGFSGFGTQGPSKKRKFNPSTDAMVEGQDLAKIDKGGRKGQGSGGNDVPLGRQRFLGQMPLASRGNNDDEIDLDLDEEDIDPNFNDSEAVGEEDDNGPRYIDTSMPAPADSSLHVEDGRPRDLKRASKMGLETHIPHDVVHYVPALQGPSYKTTPEDDDQEEQGGQAPGTIGFQLPGRPLPLELTTHSSTRPTGGEQHNRGHGGQRNEAWYVDYYDSNFNENPWAQLERSHGLQTSGTWLERTGRR